MKPEATSPLPTLTNMAWDCNISGNPGLNICLTVKGLIICGEIIGVEEFIHLRAKMTHVKQEFSYSKDELEKIEPTIIRLANAQIWGAMGGPTPSDEGVFWEGKIDSVDGYWIGALTSNDSNE